MTEFFGTPFKPISEFSWDRIMDHISQDCSEVLHLHDSLGYSVPTNIYAQAKNIEIPDESWTWEEWADSVRESVEASHFHITAIENKPLKTPEPACRCDIKALTGFGHDTDCQYIKWKRGLK